MTKIAAQSVSTAIVTANSTTINEALRKCPKEKSAVVQTAGEQPAGVGATGKRTKRAAASTKETLFSSSPLASRMRDDLVLAGCGEETQKSYLREMKKMAVYLKASPDKITENDLRRYMLYLKNELELDPNSLKVTHAAVKFFYRNTCVRPWVTLAKINGLMVDKSEVKRG